MKPVMMFIVVDLPAPFGPRKPTTSPASTEKLMPDSAVACPYFLTRFSTFSMLFSLYVRPAGHFA